MEAGVLEMLADAEAEARAVLEGVERPEDLSPLALLRALPVGPVVLRGDLDRLIGVPRLDLSDC